MNMKKSLGVVPIIASVLMISVLAGCKIRDPQDIRPVEWYEKHDAERAETLAECMRNPDTADQTPDCVNASRAESNVKSGTK